MHSVWTVYTLFITVKIVSQSQQMRKKKKKKKKKKTWTYKHGRGAQTPPISAKSLKPKSQKRLLLLQLACRVRAFIFAKSLKP